MAVKPYDRVGWKGMIGVLDLVKDKRCVEELA